MTVPLTIPVPDDLMVWLAAAAERNCRTPQGQALWLLKNARGESQRGTDKVAKQALFAELQKLHENAGLPTFRVLTERIRQRNGNTSLSTVHSAITGKLLPSWTHVESIVIALDGNTEHFRDLWIKARAAVKTKRSSKQ